MGSFIILPLLAGAVLALAWWDWAYQGQILAWWHGERVYAFFWRQLGWMLLVAECVCLGLWGLAVHTARREYDDPLHASLPFALSLFAIPFFIRYAWHPFGVQPGSAVWTYGLAAVTVAVVAWPLGKWCGAQEMVPSRRRLGWYIVCTLAALYLLLFGFLSTAQHTSFRTHALDTGTMDQAAWNTIHGRILERTPLYRPPAAGSRYESRFLDAKLELIFIPLSALYWLWADPRLLLVIQTLFLAVGAIPLYQLICERTGAILPAILVAAAYLLYLPLHYINMAEFHPSALMVPFFIASWRAMQQNKWKGYYGWLILALSCRIDAAFVALALGVVIWAWKKGARRHGLYTLLLAACWLIADFALVVPIARQVYGAGAGSLLSRRFGLLGETPGEIVRSVLTQPKMLVNQILDRDKIQTLFDLFAPIGPAALLSLPALLPALPVLFINLLADSAWQNSIQAHYMAPVIPFLWIAAGEGIAWLWKRNRKMWATFLALFALLNTLLVSFLFSPFPPGKTFHLADFYQPSSYQENIRQILALVPDEATVCAQSDLHPHLSQRRDICLFQHCQLQQDELAEYVVLDLDATSTKSPLGFHAFYELVDFWLARVDFGVVAQQGGVLLLRQGAPRDTIPQVRSALDAYGQALYRVRFVQARVPARLKAQELYRVPVTLGNEGSQCWSATDWLPVRLSYRWWTDSGAVLAVEALRTDVPHRVEPGNQVHLQAWLLAPPRPGEYILEWDMLREGDSWFSDQGGTMLRQRVWIE